MVEMLFYLRRQEDAEKPKGHADAVILTQEMYEGRSELDLSEGVSIPIQDPPFMVRIVKLLAVMYDIDRNEVRVLANVDEVVHDQPEENEDES